MGFEPTRAEHIGLAVQRLNHSATSSIYLCITDTIFELFTLYGGQFTFSAQLLVASRKFSKCSSKKRDSAWRVDWEIIYAF